LLPPTETRRHEEDEDHEEVIVNVAISKASLLTPLDGEGEGTWGAICAGRRVAESVAVRDELLDGDVGLDRSIRLALAVARRVYGGGGEVGLFCGTSKGPVGTYLRGVEKMRRGETLTEVEALHVVLGVGAMGVLVRERLGISAPAHTSVAACSSGLHALHRAAAAIGRGECERALVVAADASLHALFEASFARLGVLSPRRVCEPFGAAGEGFFVVEAGAAVLLEAAEVAREPMAWLEGSWIGADSTGLIAMDEQTETLRAGLRRFGDSAPAFVHAHATGTSHDAYELAAIRGSFGEDVPVFSHKKWLGHSLGAAGLVSVVLSAMCHAAGRTVEGDVVGRKARSVTIAQGFGGHVGVVGLRGNDQ
jgi:hypothetical protein